MRFCILTDRAKEEDLDALFFLAFLFCLLSFLMILCTILSLSALKTQNIYLTLMKACDIKTKSDRSLVNI